MQNAVNRMKILDFVSSLKSKFRPIRGIKLRNALVSPVLLTENVYRTNQPAAQQ